MDWDIVIRPSLLLEKSCLYVHNYTQSECDNIADGDHESDLEIVQETVSNYERNLLIAAMPLRIIFCLLAGPWMDRNGRKFALILPIFARCLANVTYIINYALIDTAPFELLYLEYVIELGGNYIVYYLAEYSYMADITTPTKRTSRISYVDGTDYISTMIGTALSGAMINKLDYFSVFGLSAVLSFMAVLYGLIFVKESLNVIPSHTDSKQLLDETEKENVSKTNNDSHCSSCVKCNDIVSGFQGVIKPRPDYKRRMVLMLIFNFACVIFTYNGTEGSHRYLYAQYKYGWEEKEFTLYYSVYRIFYLITLWIILPICSQYLRLHDATLGIFVAITGAISMIIPAFVKYAWGMYVGIVVGCLVPAGTTLIRSMTSRCVEENEVGKVFSVISLMDAIGSSLVAAAYQEIYSATVDTFAGAFLLVNAGFFILTIPNNFYLRKYL